MEQYLQHHGILGQKWGVRRYQNADGTLTSAGKKRYGIGDKIKSFGNKVTAPVRGAISKEVKRIEKGTSIAMNAGRKHGVVSAVTANIGYEYLKFNTKNMYTVVSSIPKVIGKAYYEHTKNNATPMDVAIVRGMEFASKSIDAYGAYQVAKITGIQASYNYAFIKKHVSDK